MKIHFIFRILAAIGALAFVASRSAATAPYVQYTSGVGASNPTCTIASGTCAQTIGTACLVEVSRNGVVISSTYHARTAPSTDPGPCGALTPSSNDPFGEKNITTTTSVILQ
jgi:hypothetical protein